MHDTKSLPTLLESGWDTFTPPTERQENRPIAERTIIHVHQAKEDLISYNANNWKETTLAAVTVISEWLSTVCVRLCGGSIAK